jgi:competence protein ComEA
MIFARDFLVVLVAGVLVGPLPLSTQAGEAPKTPPPETKKTTTRTDRLDINSASPAQLKAIQGLNDNQVRKIIDGRPYNRRNELVTKKVLTQETYDKIKHQISVRSAAKG